MGIAEDLMAMRSMRARSGGQGQARQQPIPLISPSGIQPYAQTGGQMPGPALSAMQAGTSLFGFNPMDFQRAAQKTARRPPSLLDTLQH